MLLSISSAFAHTQCISPSVCLLKSFMQASTFAPSPFSARASAYASHLRTAAACLSRCIRHRRRSKAKPLRGRRGRSRAAHRNQQLRLFALALADGSGLPFSLYPPPAALKSQTPQREARALPCRRTDSTVPAEFANSHYRYKNVTARRSHLNISPKGRNISHARSAYFTAPKA